MRRLRNGTHRFPPIGPGDSGATALLSDPGPSPGLHPHSLLSVGRFAGFPRRLVSAQPLEEKLEPVILHAMLAQEESEAADSPEQTDLPSQSEQANPSENGLFHRFPQSLQDQLTQTTEDWKQATRAELAAAAAGLLARSLLFLAGFFGVLILWLILCHTLNLVAKLPGLHLLNKLLGGLLGLIKGLLLLMVARWILCDLLGWIPASIAAESRLLPRLSSFSIFSLLGG